METISELQNNIQLLETFFQVQMDINSNNINDFSLSVLKKLFNDYILYQISINKYSIIQTTCISYELMLETLTERNIVDLDLLQPKKYLYMLKIKNTIYIQNFCYFLEGDIIYDDSKAFRQRAILYNLFKTHTKTWMDWINSEQIINNSKSIIDKCPKLESDLTYFRNNINYISENVISFNDLKTSFFSIKNSKELLKEKICINDLSTYLDIL